MHRIPQVLLVIRRAIWSFALLGALFCCPAGFAADSNRVSTQAQLLDHAEFLCSNCFFGASDYYYCLAADNKILIAHQKMPVLNYEDQTKNRLAPVHPAWAAWSAPGQTFPISYNEKYVWIARPKEQAAHPHIWTYMKDFAFWATRGSGKEVRLKRSAMADIFINDGRCRAASDSLKSNK